MKPTRGWRGQPRLKDEPQHELMGEATAPLLEVMGIAHRPFPRTAAEVTDALDAAEAAMTDADLPFALVMEKDTVKDDSLDQPSTRPRPAGQHHDLIRGGALPRRIEVLERVLVDVPETAAIIATTGKCGRELFTLADRPQHLYQVSSMGCASPWSSASRSMSSGRWWCWTETARR